MLCSITKWYVQVITHDLRYDPRSTIKSQELLYFMADFNAYIQPIMEKDVQWIKDNNIPKKQTLLIDGASKFKGIGLGFVLKYPQGDIITQIINYEFHATRNEVKYGAFKVDLHISQDLHIYVDSSFITSSSMVLKQ